MGKKGRKERKNRSRKEGLSLSMVRGEVRAGKKKKTKKKEGASTIIVSKFEKGKNDQYQRSPVQISRTRKEPLPGRRKKGMKPRFPPIGKEKGSLFRPYREASIHWRDVSATEIGGRSWHKCLEARGVGGGGGGGGVRGSFGFLWEGGFGGVWVACFLGGSSFSRC